MARCDKNGDGTIDQREFLTYFEQTCLAMNKFHRAQAQKKKNEATTPQKKESAGSPSPTQISRETMAAAEGLRDLSDAVSPAGALVSPGPEDVLHTLLTTRQTSPSFTERALEWTDRPPPSRPIEAAAGAVHQIQQQNASTALTLPTRLETGEMAAQTENDFDATLRFEVARVRDEVMKEQLALRQRPTTLDPHLFDLHHKPQYPIGGS